VLLRFALAARTYLNPDEAYHFFLAERSSWLLAYRASLTSAHPPLLIALLYCVRRVGNSELILRFPSVVAGGLFAWFMYKWLDIIAGRKAALVALALASLSPTLVSLGAEVRQYSVLLMLVAAGLYYLERAIQECSPGMMVMFLACECLAVLTHYSALIFVAAAGMYAATRLIRVISMRRVAAVWFVGQAALLGIISFLYLSHLRNLAGTNSPQAIAATYLGGEMFDPARSNFISFGARATFRLFHYLVNQPIVCACLLILYGAGLVLTSRKKTGERVTPSPHQLLLVAVPLVLNLGLALARVYPFGGIRQCVVLSVFIIAGVSVGAAGLATRLPMAVLAVVLLMFLSYVIPRPLGPYIRPENQRRALMTTAVGYIHAVAPPGSVFLLDHQSNFLFRYYFCRDKAIDFNVPAPNFIDFDCGRYRVSAPTADSWMYKPADFGPALRHADAHYQVPPGTKVWFFESGWAVDVEPALRAKMSDLGCPTPRQFGANIVICEFVSGNPR
jgi:4-amino-4-deoxy-L-arabinose transferase-like glycosyltransferase